MRKTAPLTLALTLLALAALFAAGPRAQADARLQWFDKLEDGIAEARKTGKPIFLELR